MVFFYRDRVSHITQTCKRLLLHCDCGKRLNITVMRRHLNENCPERDDNFVTDKCCEERCLEDLQEMVREYLSVKAFDVLVKVGKIKFPMPAVNHLPKGIKFQKWF